MSNANSDKDKSKTTPDDSGKSKGNLTGAVSQPDAMKPNAQDPLQAPQMDASPERFLPETPEHIEALGDDAPPKPQPKQSAKSKAISKAAAEEAELEARGLVRVRLHDVGGWFDGSKHHEAGAEIDVTPEQRKMLKGLKMLQPRLMPEDDDDGTLTTMDRTTLRR